MCTATWLITDEGYELWFNRDERRTRARALLPRTERAGGVAFIAPRDPDGGGSWIATNEFGLTVALLNAWSDGGEPREPRSRGLLVMDLAQERDVDAVVASLATEELARYRGFHLLALDRSGAPRVFRGSPGATRVVPELAQTPLVSSSLDEGRARLVRSELFRTRAPVDAAGHVGFHVSHEPERGPWSPCMHRDDASTVSATHVAVERDRAQVRYADGSPCTTDFDAPLVLALRDARSSTSPGPR